MGDLRWSVRRRPLSRRGMTQWSKFVVHFLAGVACAMLLVGAWSSPASAAISVIDCEHAEILNTTQFQAGLTAARGIGVWDGTSSDGMWIADSNVQCVRVSSLFFKYDEENYVEIGWFENPLDYGASSCQPATYKDKPHGLFLATVNNIQTCANIETYWSIEQWKDFRVQNPPPGTDEYWTFFVSGVQMASL